MCQTEETTKPIKAYRLPQGDVPWHVSLPPALSDGRAYVYVLENEQYVKIGISSDFRQRLQSLSGSNSGGHRILRCAVSQPTWIAGTLERLAHQKFDGCRANGEWFWNAMHSAPQEGITFEEAVSYIGSLFLSRDYGRCNEERGIYEMSLRVCMGRGEVFPVLGKAD